MPRDHDQGRCPCPPRSYTRKHAEILANPRVSYSVHHAPPGGFAERLRSRSLQVKGRACVVHDAEEIAHAVKVIREQLQEPGLDSMFDNVKPPEQGGQQVILRVDPVEALWADNLRCLRRTDQLREPPSGPGRVAHVE